MHRIHSSVLPTLRSTFRRLTPTTSTALAAAALGCAAFVSGAAAQTVTVTAPTLITSLPYTITASGKYVLAYDFSYTAGDGPALTISAANVNLDLGGYFISGSFNPASTTPVISVGDVAGVVIKNGTLANEGLGIEFTGTTDPRDYVVEAVTFTHLYEYGVLFDTTAIAGKVYGCKFSALGGTSGQPFLVVAIEAGSGIGGGGGGGGVRIEKNTIDTVSDVNAFASVGIDAAESDFAIGNTIANCDFGIGGSTFLNNLTTNIQDTPFPGGTAATGNTSVEPGNTNMNSAFTRHNQRYQRNQH